MTSSGKEKRRHSRLPIDLQYRLEIDNREYSGHISNISLSGAYLATIKPTLPTSTVSRQGNLHINTERGWVAVKCEVVYVGSKNEFFPHGAGVTFCAGDEDTATAVWNVAIQYLVQDNQLFASIS